MKFAQWTTVFVLVLMVGGITFISVYLGGSNQGASVAPTIAPASLLTFPVKKVPGEGEKVLITEVQQTGHQDFWFVNDNKQDVALGLIAKGCKCSDVEITVAPASWQRRLLSESVVQALQLPLRGLDGLTLVAALNEHDRLFPDLPVDGATTTLLNLENAVMVPAGAIGRARLSWRQPDPKMLTTFVDLWMGQRGGSVSTRLDVAARIAGPMEVEKNLELAAIEGRALEKNQKRERGWIVCWSMTRPAFDFKIEPIHERIKSESDPVTLGQPVPLSREDILKMEQKEPAGALTILSGYKIPVLVRAKAKDGTPMEWGHFQRHFRVSSSDEGIDPVPIQVRGEVLGDVSVGAGSEGGALNLGPFPRRRGKRGSILLQTDEKALDLQLDTTRIPLFVKASLDEPKETAGHRSWLLHVEVLPYAARGEFPRADDPAYRDSAIYVKTVQKNQAASKPRSIRVPVKGVANEG